MPNLEAWAPRVLSLLLQLATMLARSLQQDPWSPVLLLAPQK